MAGIHDDHSIHRLVSGEAPTTGLRVINNDLKWGTIVKVATEAGCGYYCKAWHEVAVDGEPGTSIFNCDRLSTVDMINGSKDPHPEPASPSFEDGIAAVRQVAEEFGVDFNALRWWASDKLAEIQPRGHGIGSSDINHYLSGLGNHDRELVVEEATRLRDRAALIASVAASTGRSVADTERDLVEMFAAREDPQ